jgi:O-antigen ligase
LLWSFAGLGVLVAAMAMLHPDPVSESLDAIALRGSTTIITARIIGYGVAALLCLAAMVRRARIVGVIAAAGITVPLLLTGSRGPLVALVAAGTTLAIFQARGHRRVSTAATICGTTVAMVTIAYSLVPEGIASRFDVLLGGPLDVNSTARVGLSDVAMGVIATRPLGLGWGDFSDVVPSGLLGTIPGEAFRIYPHNLPLEVGSEGGWIALAGLAFFAVAVVRALRSQRTDPSAGAIASLLVFAVINSLFSSDLNGNLPVLMLAGVVLAAGRQWVRASNHSMIIASRHVPAP